MLLAFQAVDDVTAAAVVAAADAVVAVVEVFRTLVGEGGLHRAFQHVSHLRGGGGGGGDDGEEKNDDGDDDEEEDDGDDDDDGDWAKPA